jgi:hypothetical protein
MTSTIPEWLLWLLGGVVFAVAQGINLWLANRRIKRAYEEAIGLPRTHAQERRMNKITNTLTLLALAPVLLAWSVILSLCVIVGSTAGGHSQGLETVTRESAERTERWI